MAEGLTDLGSGVGQRRSPLWSNMAYLTGLGSGRVQSTAGVALTMTALWQVYLRWSCLMYARPPFSPLSLPPSAVSTTLFPSHFPCFICFHFSITALPSYSCAFCSFSLLLAPSFSASPSPYLCQWLPPSTHYLLSICSHVFTFNLTPPHFSHHFKMLSLASSHLSLSSNSLFAQQLGSLSSLPLFPLYTVISSRFPSTWVVFYSTPQAIYYFITHYSFQT